MSNAFYPPLPPLAPPARRRGKGRLVALLVAVVLAVALVVFASPLARLVVDAEARAAGVSLSYGALSLGWGTVTLRDVRVGLDGVTGLAVELDSAEVRVFGLSATRITAPALRVTVQATPFDFVADLAGWSAAHPRALDLPISSPAVRVDARDPGAKTTWLTLEQGTLTAYAHGVVLRAPHATAAGVSIAHPVLGWSTAGTTLTIGYGADNPASAPVRVEVVSGARTAKLVLTDVALAELGLPLGLPAIASHAHVDGTGDISLPRAGEAMKGTLRASVRGLAIGFPREVESLLATQAYTVASAVEIAPDRASAHLRDLVVTAGALRLAGNADIARTGGYARCTGRLHGALSCAAVARSAATADLGSVLGGIAGGIAGAALGGEVAVDVAIDGDTRDPSRPFVRPTIGVGCGLRLLARDCPDHEIARTLTPSPSPQGGRGELSGNRSSRRAVAQLPSPLGGEGPGMRVANFMQC